MHTYTHSTYNPQKSEGIHFFSDVDGFLPRKLCTGHVAVYALRERPTQGCSPALGTEIRIYRKSSSWGLEQQVYSTGSGGDQW